MQCIKILHKNFSFLEFYGGCGGSRWKLACQVYFDRGGGYPPIRDQIFTRKINFDVVRAPSKHVPKTKNLSGPEQTCSENRSGNTVSPKGNMFSAKGNMLSAKGNMIPLKGNMVLPKGNMAFTLAGARANYGRRNMFARGPNHGWSRCGCFASQSSYMH